MGAIKEVIRSLDYSSAGFMRFRGFGWKETMNNCIRANSFKVGDLV